MPTVAKLAGSGMAVGTGTPGTLTPDVVPKENTTELIVVAAVTPGAVMVNEAVWLRNGLWGSLPAIEPLALE